VELPSGASLPEGWVLAERTDLDRYAVPRLIERFLEKHFAEDLFS
jgi:hypothetical protein